MNISQHLRDFIINKVNELFYIFEARILGRFYRGPQIYFKVVSDVDIMNNLEAIYRQTVFTMNGINANIDDEQIKELAETTHNYIESKRLNTINKIMADVKLIESKTELQKKLTKTFQEIASYIDLLTVTETSRTIAYANRDGITQIAASMNIEDPICFASGKNDIKLCKYCRKMYHSDHNPNIPKVYKLSELKEGYFKPKEWDGTSAYMPPNAHPNCRHCLTHLPPNFGFTETGRITFKEIGWNELSFQRTGNGTPNKK